MIALAAVAGGMHLVVLQVVAWAGMLVTNVGDHGLIDAVGRTFDGDHPCGLCEFVADAAAGSEENEPERDTTDVLTLKWLVLRDQTVALPPPSKRERIESLSLCAVRVVAEPGVPPPRVELV